MDQMNAAHQTFGHCPIALRDLKQRCPISPQELLHVLPVLRQLLGAKLLSTMLPVRIESQMRTCEDSVIYAILEVPMKLLSMNTNSGVLGNTGSRCMTVSGGLIILCHVAA
jgi:hypothetical protein